MNVRAGFIGAMLSFGTATAASSAEIEPGTGSSVFLGTTPTNPVAGQPFTVDVFNGPCESLYTDASDLTLDSFVGNVVTLNLAGLPDDSCSQAEATLHYPYPGIAAPGVYRVRVNMVVVDFPGLQGEFLGGRDVVVVASSGPGRRVRVPALGEKGLLAAMAVVTLMARFAHSKR